MADQGNSIPAVCLAYLGALSDHASILPVLKAGGISATFFAAPHHLLQHPPEWKQAIEEGHELGNGSLIEVTDDGRIRNWTCSALEEDLRSTDKLLRDWGMASVDCVYLPGRFHTCADGRYRNKVQRAFPICLSDSAISTTVDGQSARLQPIKLTSFRPEELDLLLELPTTPVILIERLVGPQADLHRLLLDQLLKRDTAIKISRLSEMRLDRAA